MEVENGRFNYRVIINMLIKKLNTRTDPPCVGCSGG